MKITAKEGKVFKRIIDGIIFGNEIYLGVDYSTGKPRQDKVEYYIEIDEPIMYMLAQDRYLYLYNLFSFHKYNIYFLI